MNTQPFYSIVIPTLDEEEYLPLLLEDLAQQTNQDFEVIHVDANSSDKTVSIANSYKNKLKIQTLESTKKNVAYQRNLGLNHATGTWIIFMDADNRLPDYFLDGIKYKTAKNKTIDIFTTWVKIAGDKTLNQPIEKTINFSLELYRMLDNESAFGSMIGIKSYIAKKYPFNEKQKVMEDSIFVKNIVDKGYTFEIFKDPKYTYSLRRIEATGLLKHIQINTKMILNYYVQGNDFKSKDFGYNMNGGKSYSQTNNSILKMLSEIEKLITSQPKNRLEKTKKLFKSLFSSF